MVSKVTQIVLVQNKREYFKSRRHKAPNVKEFKTYSDRSLAYPRSIKGVHGPVLPILTRSQGLSISRGPKMQRFRASEDRGFP